MTVSRKQWILVFLGAILAILVLASLFLVQRDRNIAARVGKTAFTKDQVAKTAQELRIPDKEAKNLLVDVEALGQLAKKNNVAIDEQRYQELLKSHSPKDRLLTQNEALQLRRSFLKDQLAAALAGGGEGTFLVFNYFQYNPNVFFPEDRAHIPAAGPEKLLAQKQYAKQFADQIQAKLKSGGVTASQALDQVLSDAQIGAKQGDYYFNWAHSQTFKLEDAKGGYGPYAFEEARQQIAKLSAGGVSPVFDLTMSHVDSAGSMDAGQRVSSGFAVIKLDKKYGAAISQPQDFDRWFEIEKAKLTGGLEPALRTVADFTSSPAYAASSCDNASDSSPTSVPTNWGTASSLSGLAVRLEYAAGSVDASGNGVGGTGVVGAYNFALDAFTSSTGTGTNTNSLKFLQHGSSTNSVSSYTQTASGTLGTSELFTCNWQSGKTRSSTSSSTFYRTMSGTLLSDNNGWTNLGSGISGQQGDMLSLNCSVNSTTLWWRVTPDPVPGQAGYWTISSISGQSSYVRVDGNSSNNNPSNFRFSVTNNGATVFVKYLWHQTNTMQLRETGVTTALGAASDGVSGFSASPVVDTCDGNFSVFIGIPDCTKEGGILDTTVYAREIYPSNGLLFFLKLGVGNSPPSWTNDVGNKCDSFGNTAGDPALYERCHVYTLKGGTQLATANYLKGAVLTANSSPVQGAGFTMASIDCTETSTFHTYSLTDPNNYTAGAVCGTTPWTSRNFVSSLVSTITAPQTLSNGSYAFNHWSGDYCNNSTSASCSVNVALGGIKSITAVYTAVATPDLTADAPVLSPSNPTPGQAVTFSSTVRNAAGGSTAAASSARFCVDNTSCYTTTSGRVGTDVSVGSLAAGAAAAVGNSSGSSWSATSGSHSVTVCADVPGPSGVVSESNENNNCSTTNFTITVPFDYSLNNPNQIVLTRPNAGNTATGNTNLTVTQAAGSNIQDVTLSQSVPAGAAIQSQSLANCTGGWGPTCIPSNSITINSSSVPGTYTVTVTGQSAGLTNKTSSYQLLINTPYQHSWTAYPSKTSVRAGDTLTLTGILTNVANGQAPTTTVSTIFPSGSIFSCTSFSASSGNTTSSTCNSSTTSLVWTKSPGLTLNGQATYTVNVNVGAGGVDGQQYCFNYRANPGIGTNDPGGVITQVNVDSLNLVPPQACVTYGNPNNPYVSTSQADVHAGGGFGNACNATVSRNISGRIGSSVGSKSTYVVSATGNIFNFGSGNTFTNVLDFGNLVAGNGSHTNICRPDLVTAANNWINAGKNNAIYNTCPGTNPAQNPSSYVVNNQITKFACNLTINFGTNKITTNGTLYVVGDVYIKSNIIFDPLAGFSRSGALGFGLIATGNIYIDKGVTQLDGYYFAGGTINPDGSISNGIINTCYDVGGGTAPDITTQAGGTACATNLSVKGLLMGNRLLLHRTGGDANSATAAAEQVDYRALIYIAPPPAFGNFISTPRTIGERPPLY